MNKDIVIRAYLDCAIWTDNPSVWDTNSPDFEDYEWAENIYLDDIHDLLNDDEFVSLCKAADISEDQIGHDIWLTRNGHGAGFWDRGYPDNIGEKLTDIVQIYGSTSVILGDDNKLHLE